MYRLSNTNGSVALVMEVPNYEKRYHVVCRECAVEQLCETADDARALEREHAAETGHRVVVGCVG